MKNAEKRSIKHRKDAAAMIAAALATVYLVIEFLVFALSFPASPPADANAFCTEGNETGVFFVDGKRTLRFSAEVGRVETLSFSAQWIEGNGEYNYKPLTVKVWAVDPADSEGLTLYRTEKFYAGESSPVSRDISIDIPEEAGEIVVEFGSEGYAYKVGEIVFNSEEASSFNFTRAAIVLFIILMGWLFVRFDLAKTYFDPQKHKPAAFALVAVCAALAVIMICMMSFPTASVPYPFDADPVYYNPYEQQFDAIMKGQLHLDLTPSDKLLELEDPYDPANRVGVSYSWDRAFYDGKYYSYFGMAPLFTVYFPHYLIFGSLPSENTVTAVFALMTAIFFALSAVKWAAMYTRKLPLSLLFLGTVGALVSSQVFLIMRGRAKFYYIATIAGMAFTCLFIWLLLCGISGTVGLHKAEEEKRGYVRYLMYALAGIAFGLLFLSRFNMALLLAFPILGVLFFRVLTEKKEDGRRRLRPLKKILLELTALGVPVVAAVVFQLVLNYLRFDSFFEFGTTYQLTVSDISQNRLRLSDLPASVYHYFLHPLSLCSDFPFVSLRYETLNNYGHYVYVDTGMGLLASPIMWALLGSVIVFMRRRRDGGNKAVLALSLVGMAVVALFNFCLGGVIFRYTCDLTVLGAFAAMAVVFSLHEGAEDNGGEARVTSLWVSSALFVFSAAVCLGLAFSLNANLTSYYPGIYMAIRSVFGF